MRKTSLLLSLAIAHVLAVAHAAPDAGQTLQQLQQTPLSLPKKDQFIITAPALAADTAAGGEAVEVNRILIAGTSKFTAEYLLEQALGGAKVIGKKHDLSVIKHFATQISLYYREHGYPFARAFIPAQTIENGILQIQVVEGQYGKVVAVGSDEKLNQQAQAFLAPLKSGDVIESSQLERSALILSDQAGIKSAPAVQPGSEVGTGDLVVDIKRDKRYAGSLGFDNHGNHYTGENKAKANLNINSPFMLGDQINLSGQLSEEQMWFGNLGYNLPLNGSGLRGTVSYAHTYYQLGKDFKDLGAKGTADIVSAGLSYALIRSQKSNLALSVNLQHKTLSDDPSKTSDSNTKQSNSLPIALSFDTRDTLFGGAVTFGSVTWTKGKLELDDYLLSQDSNKTEGDFSKLGIDLARLQGFTDRLSLYVRGSGQWSDKNLDSSEGFGIGGVTGVRAYPSGEGYGNIGWTAQTELRYMLNANFAPYAFYDAGSSTANQISINGNTTRNLSGAGIGLRYTSDHWSADVSGAWRMTDDAPSDKNIDDAKPRLWGSVNYHF